MPREAGWITLTEWSVYGRCRFACTVQTEPWPSCGAIRHTKLSVLFFRIIKHHSLADFSGWFLLVSKSCKMFNINVLTKSVFIKFQFWLGDGWGECSSAAPYLDVPLPYIQYIQWIKRSVDHGQAAHSCNNKELSSHQVLNICPPIIQPVD